MNETVADWMCTAIPTVSGNSTVDAAIACMEGHGVRHVCVVGGAGELVGILAKADLSRAMPAALSERGYEAYSAMLRNARVSMLMTSAPLVTSPEVPVSIAAALMEDCRIGALPVVDGGALVGVLALGDCPESNEAHGPVEPFAMAA